jgi:regulatory protein
MTKKITSLKIQQKNHQRVNVYLDGEFAFGLSRIIAAWLYVGQELSDEKIAQLQEEDSSEKAYQRALHFLSFRPRSTTEVQKYLLEHQVQEEKIETVVERLKNIGLLDDNRFAETWVENRSEFRPRSRRALAYELRMHGLDDQVIQETLENINTDEETFAYQAALKKSRNLKNLEWQEFRKKLSGFLARRGFGYDTIQPVVKRIWDEQPGNTSLDFINFTDEEETL